MKDPDRTPRPVTAANPTVLWIIAVLLAVIATALWMRPGDRLLPAALAQNQPLAGARGVFAFTGPLERDQYGLFMLDVDTGTVWCYEIQGSGAKGETRLKLIAARSWIFDRYLEEFNTGEPIPSEVRDMVQQQRAGRSPTSKPAGSN